jgi:hypothetical protein
MINMIEKIVSGGQTGADRAALDVALRHGFPHGGWCPKGRKAEDGPIGGQYQLDETPTANYLQRTEWNARDSDGTVVFTLAKEVSGGSLRTMVFARKHKRPVTHIFRSHQHNPEEALQRFVTEHGIKVLNVAGPRESKEPGIWQWVCQVVEDAFSGVMRIRGWLEGRERVKPMCARFEFKIESSNAAGKSCSCKYSFHLCGLALPWGHIFPVAMTRMPFTIATRPMILKPSLMSKEQK